MKSIMESWRRHLSENQTPTPEGIDLEFLGMLNQYGSDLNEGPKWDKFKKKAKKTAKAAAAAAGIATAGAGIGAGLGQGLVDAASDSPTHQAGEYGGELTKSKSYGTLKGSPIKRVKRIVDKHAESVEAAKATGGKYNWIPPENFGAKDYLPYPSMQVDDYRDSLQKSSIEELHKQLFATSGLWGGSDMAQYGGKQVLPPSWSIAFDIYRTKVQNKINQVLVDLDKLDGDPAKVQAHFGASPEEVEKKLLQYQRVIQTK